MANHSDCDEAWLPAGEASSFDPDRYSFEWTADYAAFRARPLRWFDDASYAAYQAADGSDE